MESKCCCSKLPIILSILALAVAICSYFCPKKNEQKNETPDDQMKSLVVGVIRDNPQLVMDAMGEGMAKKREDTIKQLASDVAADKGALIKMGMKFGNSSAKTTVIAFIDPCCKHCMEYQKEVVKLVQANKDILFVLLPVAVLGENSINLAKFYYAVYEHIPNKALAFIECILNSGSDDKAIKKALESIGTSSKVIEPLLQEADEKTIANGKKAEKLKIPVVPAVFCINGSQAEMVETPDMDHILKLVEANGSLVPEENAEKK